eukprot:UN03755
MLINEEYGTLNGGINLKERRDQALLCIKNVDSRNKNPTESALCTVMNKSNSDFTSCVMELDTSLFGNLCFLVAHRVPVKNENELKMEISIIYHFNSKRPYSKAHKNERITKEIFSNICNR